MFEEKAIVESIMEHAGAALIVQHVQERLKEEQKRRLEFYDKITEEDKAEFINGEIIYHSPVVKEHNEATKHLLKLLDTYVSLHQLGFVGVEKILTRFSRNDYEPDICFFNNDKAKDFQKGQMFFPVPDLVVEVLSQSPEALKRDRKTKFEDYELHGVGEYWIVDSQAETIEQYLLTEGKYELLLKTGEGILRSHMVEGFAMPIRAAFDSAANLEALKHILL